MEKNREKYNSEIRMLHSNQCKTAINKPRYWSMSCLCEQDLAYDIAKKSMCKNKQENMKVCPSYFVCKVCFECKNCCLLLTQTKKAYASTETSLLRTLSVGVSLANIPGQTTITKQVIP